MTDNSVSFAAAKAARRHYPAKGPSDGQIVDAVHRLHDLTQRYLNEVRNTVLPIVENTPLGGNVPGYEHFEQVVWGLVALKLTRPLLRMTVDRDEPDNQSA